MFSLLVASGRRCLRCCLGLDLIQGFQQIHDLIALSAELFQLRRGVASVAARPKLSSANRCAPSGFAPK